MCHLNSEEENRESEKGLSRIASVRFLVSVGDGSETQMDELVFNAREIFEFKK